MEKYKKVFIIIFFILLVLPIVFINFKQNYISEIDNTKLLNVEEITDVQTLETYVEERIGFRTSLINTYNVLNDKLFHEMMHPIYTYGKENYVFFNMPYEKVDTEYLDSYVLLIKNMQNYVNSRGSYFLFVLNPTKINLYSEYLPKGYHFNNLRVEYLKSKLDELNVNYLDNEEILKEKKSEEQVFNKQYDAGHWNELGAFYGINNIYSRIKKDGLNISNIKISDYNLTYRREKYLPVSTYPIDENIPLLELKNTNYVINNIDGALVNEKYKYCAQSTNNEKNYSVLLFRGSYFGEKEKFLANNFRHVTFVHNYYNAINFDYFFNLVDFPDIVIMDAVEYAISDTYYPVEKMSEREYNPPYFTLPELQKDKFTDIKIQIDYDNEELVTIKFNNEDIGYAYLKIGNRYYDFSKNKTQFAVSLRNYDVNVIKELIIINKDITKKYVINV